MNINTVTGQISTEALGKTLMHEHLQIAFTGWESDTLSRERDFQQVADTAVDKLARLKDAGYSTLVDPCPSDLGRDVHLMAEVATRAGFNIICATGLYSEHLGGAGHWLMRMQFDPDWWKYLADVFINEIEHGVGDTGIKPGVLKVATAHPPMTDYEKGVFKAAALASKATGTPIMTHTDGILGDEQIALLQNEGIAPGKVIVGHTCCSDDHAYHDRIAATGAFIGFDRFGLDVLFPDERRIENLIRLLNAGFTKQLIVSHDSVHCYRRPFAGPELFAEVEKTSHLLHFHEIVTPRLLESGVTQADLDCLLMDNPRRFFESYRAS